MPEFLIPHECPLPRRWYTDPVSGSSACVSCGQVKECLIRGHHWARGPDRIAGNVWCQVCHIVDGLGITVPPEVRAALLG